MKKFLLIASILLSLFVFCFSESAVPFPNHTEYTAGCIRPSLWTQEELDNHVREYYDMWKERYLTDVPNSEKSMKFVNFAFLDYDWLDQTVATVSEAHGYGMMILASMAGYDEKAKEDFDAMYNYFKSYPSVIDSRLMSWKQLKVKDAEGNLTGVKDVEDNDSVTDGDLDIAYALLMADKQWGSDGEIGYKQEALNILDGILDSEVHPEYGYLLLGDWSLFKNEKLDGSRASDYFINHMTFFSEIDEENSARWEKVRETTINICTEIYRNYSENCGLLPDFIVRTEDGKYIPAEGEYLETEHDGDHNWNSCRVPWRIPLDYIVSGNSELLEQVQAMNSWIKEEAGMEPLKINPGYYILNGPAGTPIIRDWEGTDMSFVSPFAVAAMVGAENQGWLDNLWISIISDNWDTGTPFEESAYFPNTIRMLVMIIVSGNWWPLN